MELNDIPIGDLKLAELKKFCNENEIETTGNRSSRSTFLNAIDRHFNKPIEPIGINPIEPIGINPIEPIGINPIEPIGIKPIEPIGIKPIEPIGINPIEPMADDVLLFLFLRLLALLAIVSIKAFIILSKYLAIALSAAYAYIRHTMAQLWRIAIVSIRSQLQTDSEASRQFKI